MPNYNLNLLEKNINFSVQNLNGLSDSIKIKKIKNGHIVSRTIKNDDKKA